MPRMTDVGKVFEIIKPLAAREDGVGLPEIMEATNLKATTAFKAINALRASGELHRLLSNRFCAYFLTPEAVAACVASRKEAQQAKRKAVERERLRVFELERDRVRCRAKQTVVKKERKVNDSFNKALAKTQAQAMRADLPVIIPADVKYTRAVFVPDQRYHVEDRIQLGGFLTEWMDLRRQA